MSERKNVSEAKSKVPRAIKTKLSLNQLNNNIKFSEKFGINVPNSTIEVLTMNRNNNNTLWVDAITKEMSELERLGVF